MKVYNFNSITHREGFIKGKIVIESDNIKVIHTGVCKNSTKIFSFNGILKNGVNTFMNDNCSLSIDIKDRTYIMTNPESMGKLK